jgi:hypothetical protein
LTCSGKAAGLNASLPIYAELSASVMWKCDGAQIYTDAFTGEAQIVATRNGEGFTISWTPPAVPPEQPSGCASGTWTRWESSAGRLGIDYEVVSLFIVQPGSVALSFDFGVIYPT